MTRAPLGSKENPIHSSTLYPLACSTEFLRAPSGRHWARTMAGRAFHAMMRDELRRVPKRTPLEYFKAACDAEPHGVEFAGDQTPETFAKDISAWHLAATQKFVPSCDVLAEWSFFFCILIDGREVWYEGTVDAIFLSSILLIDWKSGDEPPQYCLSPQHHLYSLAVLLGWWSNPRHFADRHQLDWSTATEPLRHFGVFPPFRYIHVPRMVGPRASGWNILACATDGNPMSVADSMEYVTQLTRKLLSQTVENQAMSTQQQNQMIPAQTTAITPLNQTVPEMDVFRLGQVFKDSGFFADCRDANQAVVKILAGKEMGIGPFRAMNGIHIIKGKACPGAGIIASKIKGSGKYDYTVVRLDDLACELEFFELRNGNRIPLGKSSFSMIDARKAGTQNTEKFPRNMLFARAVSNGAKWYTPDVFGGPVYVPEEMQDIEQQQDDPQVKQITATVVEPVVETPAPTAFTWGKLSEAQKAPFTRLHLNLKALGYEKDAQPEKILAMARALYPAINPAKAADIDAKIIGAVIGETEKELDARKIPRPERPMTPEEQKEAAIREVVGEFRTASCKAVRDLFLQGAPIEPNDLRHIIDTNIVGVATGAKMDSLRSEEQELVAKLLREMAEQNAAQTKE